MGKPTEKVLKRVVRQKKPQTLEEIVEALKERGVVLKPSRRRYKRRPTGRKDEYTPEQYEAKKTRDKATWVGVEGTWKHLKKTYESRARKRGIECQWKISLEEWWTLWRASGSIQSLSKNGRTLFSLRGKGKDDCKVWRINPLAPWTLDNMLVIYQGEIYANGRKLCQQLNDCSNKKQPS